MFINTLNCFFFVCTKKKKKDKTFTNLENNVKCYCLLREWEKKQEKKQNKKRHGIQHCASLNCRLCNAHIQHQIFHDTHTLKSSFETYKNALKNMYIDIFICIQIGPSQQKTNTHTIHMSEFCQKRFSTETDVSVKSAQTPYIEVKSPGRENLQLPKH